MFFKLYQNTNIGFKLLSDADLGASDGNQTHIGLLDNTFGFITDNFHYSLAQLIYEDTSKELISLLNFIKNPNGSYRSPKIRSGKTEELIIGDIKVNSIVREIRKIASKDTNSKCYLMWFGLENKDLVFFLIKENSQDYVNLKKIIGDIPTRAIFKDDYLNKIVKYLNTKVNTANDAYLQELETAVETCSTSNISRINPKEIDLIKARKLLRKIGKEGESLLNEYLSRQKKNNNIQSYNWMNKNRESGKPFDFEIIDNNGDLYYSDAKSTSYNFERNMFFSSNELKFINKNRNYLVHRIYNMNKQSLLKISNNIACITDNFISHYIECQSNIALSGLKLNSVKVEVPPTLKILAFKDESNFII